MSLREIKENVDNLNELDNNTLQSYVHELLVYQKRQDSKIMSLRTEIKYLTRQLKKVRDIINKSLDNNIDNNDKKWSKRT